MLGTGRKAGKCSSAGVAGLRGYQALSPQLVSVVPLFGEIHAAALVSGVVQDDVIRWHCADDLACPCGITHLRDQLFWLECAYAYPLHCRRNTLCAPWNHGSTVPRHARLATTRARPLNLLASVWWIGRASEHGLRLLAPSHSFRRSLVLVRSADRKCRRQACRGRGLTALVSWRWTGSAASLSSTDA